MKQALWWLPAALLFCAAPAAAQFSGLAEQGGGGKPPAIPVIKLKVQPAKAAVPVLKYRLLPEALDLKPGNAVFLYYRSFSPEWQGVIRSPQTAKAIEKWTADTTKLPPDELKFVQFESSLKEMDMAARRAYCDWELLDRARKEGIGLLLPDVQAFRTFGVLLSARARFEMAEKKYDKAIHGLQTSFALSRHISEAPTLIHGLVGAAITQVAIGDVEQLIQQPGAPSMYWALTDLPRPFIDLRKPLQGEKFFIESLFPGWRAMVNDVKARPLSQLELDDLLAQSFGFLALLKMNAFDQQLFETKAGLAVIAAASYPKARKFLLDQGRPKAMVDKMPVLQVALMHEIYNVDRFFDDSVKWYGFPYPEMRKGTAAAEEKLKLAKSKGPSNGTVLATLLMPAVHKVFEASYRVDRKIALLRVVEAIRLHADAHDGQLPAALKDITAAPVPDDPFTLGPFDYLVKGQTAIVSTPVPVGQSPQPGSVWTYEITVQP